MKIESALKMFGPKGMHISDTPRATASEGLTATDLMGAIGLVQAKAPMGVAALLIKADISPEDREKAVKLLTAYARKHAPRLVIKGAGTKLGRCLVSLSTLALEEYLRCAGSTYDCQDCKGRGLVNSLDYVTTHPGCGDPDEPGYTPPRRKLSLIEKMCVTCHGKGVISARCRCGGTGRVRDLKKSVAGGIAVDKPCERCDGAGFRRAPGSRAYRVIATLVPDLTERTWNRNWKPFFESLLSYVEAEVSHADTVFQKVTR